jgi:hypothetical protein
MSWRPQPQSAYSYWSGGPGYGPTKDRAKAEHALREATRALLVATADADVIASIHTGLRSLLPADTPSDVRLVAGTQYLDGAVRCRWYLVLGIAPVEDGVARLRRSR